MSSFFNKTLYSLLFIIHGIKIGLVLELNICTLLYFIFSICPLVFTGNKHLLFSNEKLRKKTINF